MLEIYKHDGNALDDVGDLEGEGAAELAPSRPDAFMQHQHMHKYRDPILKLAEQTKKKARRATRTFKAVKNMGTGISEKKREITNASLDSSMFSSSRKESPRNKVSIFYRQVSSF